MNRRILSALTVAVLTMALLGSLTRPASAQMGLHSGRIVSMSGNTITLLDAAGNQQTFIVGDATLGSVNLQPGNTVTLSLFPGSDLINQVTLIRNAEFDPALNPDLNLTPVYYYP